MGSNRFDRNERFFGKEGQEKIRASRVAIVGVGGLGTHVVQQLSLLGVGGLALIDGEEVDHTNRNGCIT
jgi:tRNA A37 threonylcarbamoyladenosine dehydratase